MRKLRCRAGDLARVIVAWNPVLVGRIVLVGELHSRADAEWNVTLLGDPGVTLTKDRKRITVANSVLAYDVALEPLRGDAIDHISTVGELHHA